MKKLLLLLSIISIIAFGCKSQHEKDWEAYEHKKQTYEMYHAAMKEQQDSIMRVMDRERADKQLSKSDLGRVLLASDTSTN